MAAHENLTHALAYARRGMPVFPVYHVAAGLCACRRADCRQPGKHPRCSHGHNDATTDAAQIRRWWSAPKRDDRDGWQCDPSSNIGYSVPDGVCIVDIDPRNGGEATADKIIDLHGDSWTHTHMVNSGGGGWQCYFRVPTGLRFPKTLDAFFGPGVDLKQLGGYVLLPPSSHKSGGLYSWRDSLPVADAPAWLLAVGRPRAEWSTQRTLKPSDAGELTEELCRTLDHIVELLDPEYTEGKKHNIARSIGGYFCKRGLPSVAAEYVIGALPSEDPEARVRDALWPWTVANPDGWSSLRDLLSVECLAKLETLTPNPILGRLKKKRRRIVLTLKGDVT